jgi:hypothetical protein
MENQFINFKIAPDGTIFVDMEGYKGPACEGELKRLSSVLGTPIDTKRKPDYYNSVNEEHQRE